jgi:putative ABC transport system substrate-binding protein
VIVAIASTDAAPVRRLSSTLPIVVIYSGLDPVADGLIASFARPGGNVTGVSRMLGATRAKRLELIKAMLPTAGRIGVLFAPPADAALQAAFETNQRAAARTVQVELQFHPYRSQDELMAAFPAMVGARPHRRPSDPASPAGRVHAARVRRRRWAVAYGPDWSTLLRQLAQQVDRILRGARPADLPM